MKKGIITLLVVCVSILLGAGTNISLAAQSGDVPINEQNFPGEKFREKIAWMCDNNHDNILSQDEINQRTEMELYYPDNADSWNIIGIEYFTNLQKLTVIGFNTKTQILNRMTGTFCNNKKLTEVDVDLQGYDFSGDELSRLFPVNQLEKLSIKYNNIPKDSLKNAVKLKTLVLENTFHQKSLDFSEMKELESFRTVGDCDIASMNFSENKKLIELDVCSSSLTKIILPKSKSLGYVEINSSKLKHIDLSNVANLKKLDVYSASLTKIILPKSKSLGYVEINSSKLKHIDLSNVANLRELTLRNMHLKKLNLSHNGKLKALSLKNVPIKSLNLSKNIKLKILSIYSGELWVPHYDDLFSDEDVDVYSGEIPWYTNCTISTKITFPKKNSITEFTCFTKNKIIDLCRCNHLKEINVSPDSSVKLNKQWFKKNKKKVVFYSEGSESTKLKVKNAKKYVTVKAL